MWTLGGSTHIGYTKPLRFICYLVPILDLSQKAKKGMLCPVYMALSPNPAIQKPKKNMLHLSNEKESSSHPAWPHILLLSVNEAPKKLIVAAASIRHSLRVVPTASAGSRMSSPHSLTAPPPVQWDRPQLSLRWVVVRWGEWTGVLDVGGERGGGGIGAHSSTPSHLVGCLERCYIELYADDGVLIEWSKAILLEQELATY